MSSQEKPTPAVETPAQSADPAQHAARDALTFLGRIQAFLDQVASGIRAALAARARGDAGEWHARRTWAAGQLVLLVDVLGALARRIDDRGDAPPSGSGQLGES